MAYDTVGALGGMFAPAYIHGNQQSEAAVLDWNKRNHVVNNDVIEQSRVNGVVDQNALRAAAQGGPYDVNAQRDAIAAAVVAQPAASGGLKYLPNGQLDQNDPGNIAYYYKMMGGGGGAAAAAAPQQQVVQQPGAQQPGAQQPAYQQPAQQPGQSVDYGYTSWGTQGA